LKNYAISDWTDSDCDNVERMFSLLSGKYTMLLMSVLALEGEQSFGNLKRSLNPISSKTLSDRLSILTKAGLISNRRARVGRVEMSYYSQKRGNIEFLDILVAFRNFNNS